MLECIENVRRLKSANKSYFVKIPVFFPVLFHYYVKYKKNIENFLIYAPTRWNFPPETNLEMCGRSMIVTLLSDRKNYTSRNNLKNTRYQMYIYMCT